MPALELLFRGLAWLSMTAVSGAVVFAEGPVRVAGVAAILVVLLASYGARAIVVRHV